MRTKISILIPQFSENRVCSFGSDLLIYPSTHLPTNLSLSSISMISAIVRTKNIIVKVLVFGDIASYQVLCGGGWGEDADKCTNGVLGTS